MQSEYVAGGAIFRFAFHPFHRALHYVNLSNMGSKQVFQFINLSNVGFFIANQSVRIFVSFGGSPSPSKALKLFQSLKIALTHTPYHASTENARCKMSLRLSISKMTTKHTLLASVSKSNSTTCSTESEWNSFKWCCMQIVSKLFSKALSIPSNNNQVETSHLVSHFIYGKDYFR